MAEAGAAGFVSRACIDLFANKEDLCLNVRVGACVLRAMVRTVLVNTRDMSLTVNDIVDIAMRIYLTRIRAT